MVWLAPPCKKWSRMQNINQRTAEQTELLQLDRAYEHTTNLKFTRRVYLRQQRGGRQAYVEQRLWSLAWKTPALQLGGYRAIFDQCAYGAGFWTSPTAWHYIRKPTAVLSTEESFAETMSLKCPGNHSHVALQGSRPGIGSLTTAAAAYQIDMCEALSQAICTTTEQRNEQAYTGGDELPPPHDQGDGQVDVPQARSRPRAHRHPPEDSLQQSCREPATGSPPTSWSL